MRRVIALLTNGRPMSCGGYLFTDKVSGKPVSLWYDYYGREWMADNRWGWFRVERNIYEPMENIE
jgi:hypothetical protein